MEVTVASEISKLNLAVFLTFDFHGVDVLGSVIRYELHEVDWVSLVIVHLN